MNHPPSTGVPQQDGAIIAPGGPKPGQGHQNQDHRQCKKVDGANPAGQVHLQGDQGDQPGEKKKKAERGEECWLVVGQKERLGQSTGGVEDDRPGSQPRRTAELGGQVKTEGGQITGAKTDKGDSIQGKPVHQRLLGIAGPRPRGQSPFLYLMLANQGTETKLEETGSNDGVFSIQGTGNGRVAENKTTLQSPIWQDPLASAQETGKFTHRQAQDKVGHGKEGGPF